MGLDISVYKIIDKADSEDYTLSVYNYPEFSSRCSAFPEGYYDGKSLMSFRAGSYSGYGLFRKKLATLIDTTPEIIWDNPEHFKDKPFYELINFADNEGTIDYVVAEKLAKDFKEYLPKAKMWLEDINGAYYLDKYNDWLAAFDLASKHKGVVSFH